MSEWISSFILLLDFLIDAKHVVISIIEIVHIGQIIRENV